MAATDTFSTNRSAKHHPSSDLLCQYSAGTVSSGQALCIAVHLEYCLQCRHAHQRNNRIGAQLFENSDDNSVRTSVKEDLFAKLDSVANPITSTQRSDSARESSHGIPVPRPLTKLAPQGFNDLRWKMISISARSVSLFKDENLIDVGLLKLKPGGKVARHRHLGDEYTVVLTGNFSDEDGVYGPGDFLLREPQDRHTPMATRDAECICLTAQEGPLQFTGRLFGLLNPLLRLGYTK